MALSLIASRLNSNVPKSVPENRASLTTWPSTPPLFRLGHIFRSQTPSQSTADVSDAVVAAASMYSIPCSMFRVRRLPSWLMVLPSHKILLLVSHLSRLSYLRRGTLSSSASEKMRRDDDEKKKKTETVPPRSPAKVVCPIGLAAAIYGHRTFLRRKISPTWLVVG